NDADFNFRFMYTKPDFLTADQSAALQACIRLTKDPTYAKFLKVTEDQVKQLKEIPTDISATSLLVSPADIAKLRSAFNAYIASPKSDNEQAVVKLANQIGTAAVKPSRDALAPRVEKIKQILSPEVLANFKQT